MLASVTIDLDGLDCYHAIHGLEPPGAELIYGLALGRFLDLLEDLGLVGTLFVITRYLDGDARIGRRLARAAERGHELASHTHGHPYDLGRRSETAVGAELDAAAERIEAIWGRPPVGFRAPGYSVSESVLNALEARGYRYDSSVFPCPPYYLAKAAVMGGMRLLGRRSGSALTDPRALLAPLQPYRPERGRFHRPGGRRPRRLWEIPMCAVPGLRIPVIGTSLALFGSRRFGQVYGLIRRRHVFLNLEFHGIDFLGPDDEGLAVELVARQPDLRVALADKLGTYRDVVRRLQGDYDFATLEQMTEQLDRSD